MTGFDIAAGPIVAGAIATASLDAWQRALARVVGIPAPDWRLVGRWFGHMPSGVFAHENIARAKALAGEGALGWLAHYAIGAIYALVYLGLVRVVLAADPDLVSAVAFGAGTVLVPWTTLHPGMGLGLFARKASRPARVAGLSVVSHVVFGLGLFLGVEVVEHLGMLG